MMEKKEKKKETEWEKEKAGWSNDYHYLCYHYLYIIIAII